MLPSRPVKRPGMTSLGAVALGALALGLSACGGGSGSGDVPEGSVAQVGDQRITAEELQRAIDQQEAAAKTQGGTFPKKGTAEYDAARRQLLDQLVLQRVVEFEARKCGQPCVVSEADVTAELNRIKKQNFGGSQAKLDKFLKDSKLTVEDARRILRLRLEQPKLYNYVTRGVRFTKADALKYYKANPAQFRQPASRTASHILVKNKALAEKIAREATVANFAQLARKYSIDPGSKAQGGNLGPIQKGQLVPEFEKVAFALKDGQISKPVKTQFGWHIITVNVNPARTIPYAEAQKGIVTDQLKAERDAAFARWRDKILADWRKRTKYADPDLAPETASTAATTPAPAATTTP